MMRFVALAAAGLLVALALSSPVLVSSAVAPVASSAAGTAVAVGDDPVAPLLMNLWIGTDSWGNQVYYEGFTSFYWARGSPNITKYVQWIPVAQFYLQLSVPPNQNDPLRPTFVQYDVQASVINNQDVLDVTADEESQELNAGYYPELATVSFNCKAKGMATVEVQFSFNLFQTVYIQFNKTCLDPNVDPYINMGSQPGTADMIAGGLVTNTTFVSVDNAYDLFYIWLDPAATANISVAIAQHRLYADQVVVFTTPSFSAGGALTPFNPALQNYVTLNVSYLCQNVNVTDIMVTVTGALIFVHHTGFENWSIINPSWQHICNFYPGPPPPGPPAPSPSPSDGGWPPAGIAFFVIFMVLVVCCIAGALYNYFGRGRRGREVVPCYGLCSQWCMKGPKKVTPQDDDAVGARTSTYGSYQEL